MATGCVLRSADMENTTKTIKAALLPCLCMLLCIAFWLRSAALADDLQRSGRNIGVRYSSGGVDQKSLNDIAFLNEDPERAGWLAWTQQQGSATAEFNNQSSSCTILPVSGNPYLLYDRSQFRHGGAPLLGDEDGCVVSAGLAYALWRSFDVNDVELLYGGESYFVRGVLRDEKEKVLLLQNPKSDEDFTFDAMEISQVPNANGYFDPAEDQVRAFASSAQISPGDVVIGYEGQALALRQLALLPLGIILLLGCFRIARRQRADDLTLPQRALRVAFIIALLGLGIWALSGWAYWPQNWRPARWAAFEFWGKQWQRTMTHTDALFSLPAYAPDLARQKEIIQVIVAIVAASLLVFPAHSRSEGGPGEKLLFALVALLGAFAIGLYMESAFQRPIWMAWPLYWGLQALYALLLPATGQIRLPDLDSEDY